MTPNTIQFHSDNHTEVLRLSKDGIWANPNIPVDEAAKQVLAAMEWNIKVLVDKAVADERERIYFQTSSDFVKAAIVEEREQIAQMIEAAPPLVQLAQNEHGGCLMCGFTPKLAAAAIRNRSNT